jgi:hypothetical protein
MLLIGQVLYDNDPRYQGRKCDGQPAKLTLYLERIRQEMSGGLSSKIVGSSNAVKGTQGVIEISKDGTIMKPQMIGAGTPP